MQTSQASRIAGGLLALTGILGIVILALDQVLRGAPMHYYALIAFVIVDFAAAGLALAKPGKTAFTVAGGWAGLRILLQIADLSQAHLYQFRYTQFADYLFNPMSSLSSSLGNPLGIPGAAIDLIVILEIIVAALAWKARSTVQAKS
jgi:hypothetical protein